MAEYERHQPEQTLLYKVVRENLETFLANAREQGAPVARFVETRTSTVKRACSFPVSVSAR